MKVHTVRVFSSTEKIEKNEQLTGKIAAMAAYKAPSDTNCIEKVINRIIGVTAVALTAINWQHGQHLLHDSDV